MVWLYLSEVHINGLDTPKAYLDAQFTYAPDPASGRDHGLRILASSAQLTTEVGKTAAADPHFAAPAFRANFGPYGYIIREASEGKRSGREASGEAGPQNAAQRRAGQPPHSRRGRGSRHRRDRSRATAGSRGIHRLTIDGAGRGTFRRRRLALALGSRTRPLTVRLGLGLGFRLRLHRTG